MNRERLIEGLKTLLRTYTALPIDEIKIFNKFGRVYLSITLNGKTGYINITNIEPAMLLIRIGVFLQTKKRNPNYLLLDDYCMEVITVTDSLKMIDDEKKIYSIMTDGDCNFKTFIEIDEG